VSIAAILLGLTVPLLAPGPARSASASPHDSDSSRLDADSRSRTDEKDEPDGDDDGDDDKGDDGTGDEGDDGTKSDEDKDRAQQQATKRQVDAHVEVSEARERLSARQRRLGHPASVSTVELGDRVSPGTTLADVLGSLAGVHVRQFGGPGDPSTVSLRGSTARQVEIWVDGVPLNALGSSVVDLSELPVDSWDQVEVFRGFAPPELGGAPIGGVVHLTSQPGTAPPLGVEVGLGSWSTRFVHLGGGVSKTSSGGGLADFRIDARYDGTQGNFPYFDDQGTLYNLLDDRTRLRANNAMDQLHLVLRGRLSRGPLDLTLSDLLLWRGEGVPGPAHGSTETARFTVIRNLASLSARLRLGVTSEIHLMLSHLAREERFRDLHGEIGPGAADSRDRYHQPIGALSAHFRPWSGLDLTPSARLLVDAYSPSNPLSATATDATHVRIGGELGFSATGEFWNERVILLSALSFYRLDNRLLGEVPYAQQTAVSDGTEWSRHFQPRIAIAFRPQPWLTVRSSLARGFRPPTFQELFGQQGSVAGNPWLGPESSETADVSVRIAGSPHRLFHGGLEFGSFLSFTRDAIVYRPNAFRVAAPTNFGRIRVGGIEVAGSLLAFKWLRVSLAATFVDSEILEGELAHIGNQVPSTPRWELDASVAVELEHHLKLQWQFAYTEGTYDSATNLFLAASRPLHSVQLRVQPDIRFPWIALDLRNLLDTTIAPQYRNPAAPDPTDRHVVALEDFRGNPLPGRSILLTVGWSPAPAEKGPQ